VAGVSAAPRSRCLICKNEANNSTFHAREMMLGSRERFLYLECSRCGCLQLIDVPDIARYYSQDYYAFRDEVEAALPGALGRWLRRARTSYHLTGRGIVGKAFTRLRPVPDFLEWAKSAEVGRDARILDVGCGNGRLLLAMRNAGFTDLTGIDPYLPESVTHPGGVTLRKLQLPELAGPFDLIMLNHAFEHMPDPGKVLDELARLIDPGGTILIRTPLADSEAWQSYREDWVQLDAPRHLFVHTVRSLRSLAESAGLVIDRMKYDSQPFQFWGSEQYRRDIPLSAHMSGGRFLPAPIFTAVELRGFEREAVRLNECGRGDQAAVFLRPRRGAEAG